MFFLLILIYFSLYIPNLTQYVFGGDSAELTAIFSNFGIAHPPGYPLLTLLNNLFIRLIPFVNNQYLKLSFINSFFILLTSFLIYKTLLFYLKNKYIAFFSVVFFFILFPIWLYGLVPEVFSFSLFLFAGQIYCLIYLYFSNKNINRHKLLFLIFIGLSIAHHHFFVFFIPGYLYLILKSTKLKKIFQKNLNMSFFLVMATGFIFYLYPPIISYLNNPIDIENTKTITGLIRLFTRASYGTFKAYPSASGDLINRLYDFFSILIFFIHDFRPIGILFIFFGYFDLSKSNRKLFNFFLIHLLSISFFFFYANFYLNNEFGVATYERFLTFLYLILVFPLAIGIDYIVKNWLLFVKKLLTNQFLIKFIYSFFYIFLIFFYFSVLRTNFQTIKLVKNLKIFDQFGKDLLLTPEKDSVIILTSDNSLFITQNLQTIKKLRKDLVIITPAYIDRSHLQKLPNINKLYFPFKIDNYNKAWLNFYKTNYQNKINIFSEKPDQVGYWAPYGLLWKYYPNKNELGKNLENLKKINNQLWKEYQYPILNKELENILFTKDVQNFYNRQLWALINFYIVTKELNLANYYANRYYPLIKDDYQFLLTYINLKVNQKNCQNKLKEAVNNFLKMKPKKSTDYKPIINYYLICEKNNKKYQEVVNQFNQIKIKEEVALDKL